MLHKIFKFIENLCKEPETSALQDAIAGLADAEKQALTEQTSAEYAAAQVICHKAMAEFQQKRVARLQAYIAERTRQGHPGHPDMVPMPDAKDWRVASNM